MMIDPKDYELFARACTQLALDHGLSPADLVVASAAFSASCAVALGVARTPFLQMNAEMFDASAFDKAKEAT